MTSAKKPKKTEQKRRRRQHDTTADWGSFDAELLCNLIQAITKDGGAIRFGYSRDGGAFSIGIYGDGKPYSEFHPATDGAVEWLEGIIYDFE